MSKKTKTAVQLALLFVLFGLLIWHAVSWHLNGKYLEMMKWAGDSRAYLAAFYNLGIILALAAVLSLGLDRIASLAAQFKPAGKSPDKGKSN
jgi:hypothetical protein